MEVELSGHCLLHGASRIEINSSEKFSLYAHEDSCAPVTIPLDIENIKVENHLVSLVHPVRVDVIEHLFSALYGLELFNVRVDVFGTELPFFDGSSKAYAENLKVLMTDKMPENLTVHEKILVSHNSSFLLYEPVADDTLIVDMELFHPYINKQRLSLEVNKKSYVDEIAPSRTFAFIDESDPRLQNLPPYGIGITKTNVHSREPLRYEDELVRHKILDLLGDLYVLKKKLFGKITGRNTSHLLNLEFTKELLRQYYQE